jgi:hypothetical protein
MTTETEEASIVFVGRVEAVPAVPQSGGRHLCPESALVMKAASELKDGEILKFVFAKRCTCNTVHWAVRRHVEGVLVAERTEPDGRRALYVWKDPAGQETT